MSQTADPNPSAPTPDLDKATDAPAAPPAKSDAAPPASATTKRKRRWRRRLTAVLITLAVIVIILRFAVPATLPAVLRKVAASYNLDCSYERVELNVLSGDFGIWHLSFKPKDGGPELLHAEYCRGNLSTRALMKGRLDVWRAEADGLDLLVDRAADGRIPALEKLLAGDAVKAPKPQPKADEKPKPPGAADLSAPLKIDALRLDHINARLHDRSVFPAVDTTVQLNVRLSDLGSAVRPTRFEVEVVADGILDSFMISGERRGNAKLLDGELAVRMRGLHLKPLEGYLRPLGIQPIAEGLSMRAGATIHLTPATQPAQPALSGTFALHDISASADGAEAAALDRLTVDVDVVSGKGAQLGKIAIDGVRAVAARSEQGAIRVAGIELVPVPASAAPAAPAPKPAAAIAKTTPAQPSAPFQFRLGEISIRNVSLKFDDRAVTPAAALAVFVDDLHTKDVVLEAGKTDITLDLDGTIRVPGIARQIKVVGSLAPFAQRKTVALSLRAQGIKPELLQPYLRAAGVESTFKDGTFACRLKASTTLDATGAVGADVQLSDVKLSDGAQLLALDDVAIRGVALDPAVNRLRVQSVEIHGPALAARQEADGTFAGLGFRTVKRAAATKQAAALVPVTPVAPAARTARGSQAPVPSAQAAPAPVGKPMRFEVGRLTWSNVRVQLDDLAAKPPVNVSLQDAGVEVKDLCIDLDEQSTQPIQPGTIRAYLAAPGVARRIEVAGTVTPRPGTIVMDVAVSGEGVTAAGLGTYLKAAGIESQLKDGSLKLRAKVDMRQVGGNTAASLRLEGLKYTDGEQELAAIDALAVSEVLVKPNELSVGDVEVERPHLAAARDADGALIFAGIKLLPPAPPAVVQDDLPRAAATSQPAQATQPAPAPPAAAVTLLKKLRVKDAAVTWSDRAVQPAVTTTATVSVDLDDLTLGRPAAAVQPATLRLTARADGSLDELTVAGTVLVATDAQNATLDVSAGGIRAGALAAYLPPGLKVTLSDGRLSTHVDAAVATHPKGGQQAKLIVSNLKYIDGKDNDSLFAMDSLRLVASRIDLPGKVIALDEVAVDGLETRAELAPGGVTRLLGISLEAVPPAPAKPAAQAEAPKPGAAAPVVAAAVVAPAAAPAGVPGAPAADAAAAAALVAKSKETSPLVTLEKLDLNIRKAALVDGTRAGATPITVSNLRLRNLDRVEVLGPGAEHRPPLKLELTGRIDPMVEQLKLATTAAPFAQEPRVTLDLNVNGIRGEGLTSVLPELKKQIDGGGMTDGRLQAHLEATLKPERRGSTAGAFDLSNGFDAELLLKQVEFRAAPDGPVLLGLEELHTEGVRVRPKTGAVQVKALELSKPIGKVVKDKEGIHVLGLVIKQQQAAPATQATTQVAEGAKPQVGTAKPQAAPTTKPAGEMRIDALTVNGLDVWYEDRSCEPPLVVPLTGLDVDVRGLSNWLPYEEQSVRFNVLVNSGKVKLPKRPKAAGGVPGAFGDIAKLAGGEKIETKVEYEDRELFAEVTASGVVALYPKPAGWMKTSVNGVELVGLTGATQQAAGVTLGGGTFDGRVDVRLPGDGSVDTKARLVTTDLRMSEPANGPIVRNLSLPMPLDAAIKVLQDTDGSITIPVDFQVKDGKLDGIGSAAVGAIGSVVVTALASAPVKVVEGVGSLAGLGGILGGGDKKQEPEKPITLTFLPGYNGLEPAELTQLAALAERMRKDKTLEVTLRHELGGGDVASAGDRANLPRDTAAGLAYQFHARKIELARLRADVAGRARTSLLSSFAEDAPAELARLRGIDRELAQTEDALDRVYDLMRPGADRQAARRTRQAAIELGTGRIQLVRDVLLGSNIPAAAARVRTFKPQFNPGEEDTDAGGKLTIVLTHVTKK